MALVDFVTNIAPHYRERLWLELLRVDDYQLRYFFGSEPRSSIRQIDFENSSWEGHADKLIRVKNYRIGGVLFWQKGVVANAAKSEARIAVFLGDMYVFSTWIAVLLFQLRGRKVVYWGHGVYGNERGVRRLSRLLFLRLGNANLVYGERAKKLLVDAGIPETNVQVIYNSLDYDLQKSLRKTAIQDGFFSDTGWFRHGDLPVLIFVGRLTGQKKLAELILAVKALNLATPKVNLILVGDGPEKDNLEAMAKDCSGSIRFYGACYQESELGKLIANADLCVSPGEIGLTAIHSLSYGTPACTHGDMSEQMPEAEAIIEGETGTFYDRSAGELLSCLEAWFAVTRDRDVIRRACYQLIDQKYNPRYQCEVFKNTLDQL